MKLANPNKLNPMQMNSMTALSGMMNSMQKIGKGKRKYSITLDKTSKKILSKFIDELKKQFADAEKMPNISQFFSYVKSVADTKDVFVLKLSYEELEFITKILSDGIKGLESVKHKWYQLIKKAVSKVIINQYRLLYQQFSK